LETLERFVASAEAKGYASEQEETIGEIGVILRRFPEGQRLEQHRFCLRPFPSINQDLRNVGARLRCDSRTAYLQGCITSALEVRHRVVPAPLPAAQSAKGVQQSCLPLNISTSLKSLQRTLHRRYRRFPAKVAVRPAQDEVHFPQRFRIIRSLCLAHCPLGPV